MLLEGYKVHNDRIPLWWRQGVAHWYRRRLNERQNDFTGLDPSRAHRFEEWDWKPKVRGRVATHEAFQEVGDDYAGDHWRKHFAGEEDDEKSGQQDDGETHDLRVRQMAFEPGSN